MFSNKLICWIDANMLGSSYESMTERIPKTGFEKELYGLLDKLSENDNPVLFVFDIKQEE